MSAISSWIQVLAQPVAAAVVAVTVAMLVTALTVRYARGRGLLDLPGQRRSHSEPTPRGGGLGLVCGALLGMAAALLSIAPTQVAVVALAAAVLVATVGWRDDHRDLPVLPRLLAHVSAAGAFVVVMLLWTGWSWWWLPGLVLMAAWSINLHNFMDGIDGLLSMQLVFVGVAMALMVGLHDMPGLAGACFALAAAATGFLFFNLPPARIFMGDVGSGCVGLLIFMLSALWCAKSPDAVWTVLILNAAFMLDAGLTLLWRMLRGRRWYTAHREHLYQWLVRSGWTHGQTGCLYLAFNVTVCAPAAWWAQARPELAAWICVTMYVLGTLAWWAARRMSLRRIRGGVERAHP